MIKIPGLDTRSVRNGVEVGRVYGAMALAAVPALTGLACFVVAAAIINAGEHPIENCFFGPPQKRVDPRAADYFRG